MKTINLLPNWYLKQYQRQRKFRLHILLMLVLAVVLMGITIAARERVAVANRSRDNFAKQRDALPVRDSELQQKQADLKRLQDLLLARRELGSTIPISSVVQQLQNDMTLGMALSNVALDVRPQPVKGSGPVGDTHNPPRFRDVAHITVVGIAPNDAQAMQFYNNVAKNELFSEVTLDYTRTGLLKGYPVRQFQIQLSLDLEKVSGEGTDIVARSGALPLASGEIAHGD